MAHIAMLLESSSLAAESTSRVCGVTGMSGESPPFALILARFPAAGIQNPTILGSEPPWFFWGDFWPQFQEPPELRRAMTPWNRPRRLTLIDIIGRKFTVACLENSTESCVDVPAIAKGF